MGYGLKQMVEPAAEPVRLDEAKLHLHVDHAYEDQKIQGLIAATRQYVEKASGRQLVTATYCMTLDCFPYCEPIRLPRPPLQAVTSIAYVDAAGVTQTLAADQYLVDETSEPGRIAPAYGLYWPVARYQMAAVRVTYTAGYGDPPDVPDDLKHIMFLMIGHWYENSEAVVTGTIATEIQRAAGALLDLNWTGEYR